MPRAMVALYREGMPDSYPLRLILFVSACQYDAASSTKRGKNREIEEEREREKGGREQRGREKGRKRGKDERKKKKKEKRKGRRIAGLSIFIMFVPKKEKAVHPRQREKVRNGRDAKRRSGNTWNAQNVRYERIYSFMSI